MEVYKTLLRQKVPKSICTYLEEAVNLGCYTSCIRIRSGYFGTSVVKNVGKGIYSIYVYVANNNDKIIASADVWVFKEGTNDTFLDIPDCYKDHYCVKTLLKVVTGLEQLP